MEPRSPDQGRKYFMQTELEEDLDDEFSNPTLSHGVIAVELLNCKSLIFDPLASCDHPNELDFCMF